MRSVLGRGNRKRNVGGWARVTQGTIRVSVCWSERAASCSQVKVRVGIRDVRLFCFPGWGLMWWRKAWQPSAQSGRAPSACRARRPEPHSGQECRLWTQTPGPVWRGSIVPHPQSHSEALGQRQSPQGSNLDADLCLQEARTSVLGTDALSHWDGELSRQPLCRAEHWLQDLPSLASSPNLQRTRAVLGCGSVQKPFPGSWDASGSFPISKPPRSCPCCSVHLR